MLAAAFTITSFLTSKSSLNDSFARREDLSLIPGRLTVNRRKTQPFHREETTMNSGPTLSSGATGDDVKRLQRLLVMLKLLDFKKNQWQLWSGNSAGGQGFPAGQGPDGGR